MRSFISKWFTWFTTEKSKYLPLSEQNKQLLINELDQCYTTDDIKLLREVLRLCVEDFTFEEHIDFELKIAYRKRLIKYCNKIFGIKFRKTLNTQIVSKLILLFGCTLLHVDRKSYYENVY